MSNYLISYDLNGSTPTHSTVDQYISLRKNWSAARILETVWYIGTTDNEQTVFDYFSNILSANDSIIVVTCDSATWNNLLTRDRDLQTAWMSH